ncbi:MULTISPECIES: hypothetical protein [unclassified Serratia (in: enterobacteria)]|uniref:hypothetical protein n=1 Tax=unclassified Serratia (in: enterobacteria) TaxID=2647522 RepID=UPI003075F98A
MRAMAKAATSVAALMLLVMGGKPVGAETITIGKGTGIVWEGMPFDVTMSGALGDSLLNNVAGLLVISPLSNACLNNIVGGGLTSIAGFNAYKIAPGVGLIPRAVGYAFYTLYNNTQETLTGTIGLPQTGGRTNSGYNITNPITGTPLGSLYWCLPPRMNSTNNFYSATGSRNARIYGTWVMVADGTQTSQSIDVKPMYAGSYSNSPSAGSKYVQIFPSNIALRISTLICTVMTTTQINFGSVQRNTQNGTELAKLTYPLSTSCTQDAASGVNANINVQFRALSGNYNATPSWLSLTQGGGYITGEIDNGVTGSGACTGTSGIPFDNTQLKVGNMTSAETSKTTSNNVTWRLCSGGSNLPTGAVNASAEVLVTFN